MSDRADAPVQTLRDWLAGRSAPERLTLARLWSVPEEVASSAATLADVLLDPAQVAQLADRLTPPEREALERVVAAGGVIDAARLEREYGRVRSHAAYADPRAYLLALRAPAPPAERLYLLALLHPAGMGARRQYVIPPDLLALLPAAPPPVLAAHLPQAPAADPDTTLPADVPALERRLLVLLALAHAGQLELGQGGALLRPSVDRLRAAWGEAEEPGRPTREEHWPYASFVRRVALAAGLLRVDDAHRLRPARGVVSWLRLPRAERLRALLDAWVVASWDELPALLGISVGRAQTRDVAGARRRLLSLLAQIQPGVWVSLAALTEGIRRVDPDFARPDGCYDGWELRSRAGLALDGFEHWQAVEGAQIAAVAGCVLRWLGLADAGMRGGAIDTFRLTPYGAALLRGDEPPDEPPDEPLAVLPTFEVVVPAGASLYARFQIGRIAQTRVAGATAIYRLTRRSLHAALDRGVGVEEILRFLREQGGRELPQHVAATLREWAGQHGRVALRRATLLTSDDPLLLEQIRRDTQVRLPPPEPLSPTAWLIDERDAAGLAERLRRAGYAPAEEGLRGDDLSERDLTTIVAALEFLAAAGPRLGLGGEVSAALRRRVAGQLPERRRAQAEERARAAVAQLDRRLGEQP